MQLRQSAVSTAWTPCARNRTSGRRKRRPADHPPGGGWRKRGSHGGAWKVAYADFVTAMMAFFLLMWLLNATTEDQRKGLADYFSPNNLLSHNSSGTGQPFGGHTAFDKGRWCRIAGPCRSRPGSARCSTTQRRPDPDRPAAPSSDAPHAAPVLTDQAALSQRSPARPIPGLGRICRDRRCNRLHSRRQPAGAFLEARSAARAQPMRRHSSETARRRAAQEARQLDAAAEQISQAVQDDPALAGLSQHLAIDVTPAGPAHPTPGHAESGRCSRWARRVPNERGPAAARARSRRCCMHLPEQVSIGGHTDAAPYPGPAMTNWELSAERANAARRMLDRCRVAGAADPGSDRPCRSRSAAAGRSAGRGEPADRDPGAARHRSPPQTPARRPAGAGRAGPRPVTTAMLTIGGFAFLLVCVFGSYAVSGGSIGVLAEALPFEMLTIGGAAIGTFVMANSMHDMRHTLGGLMKVDQGRRVTTSRTTSSC